MTCHGSRHEDAGASICKYCDAFLCLIGGCVDDPEDDDGQPLSATCDECDDPVCLQCEKDSCLLVLCDDCSGMLCRDCEQKPGADYTFCHDCGGEWCNSCAPDNVTCLGSERETPANTSGCFVTLCETCEHKVGAFTFCDGCCGACCKDCVPDTPVNNALVQAMGTQVWRDATMLSARSARGTRLSRTA